MTIRDDTENPTGSNRLRTILLCVILVPTLGIFSVSLNYDFVYDDSRYVSENPLIRSFGSSNLYQMAVGGQSPTWHPLTWLSHSLDYKLYRLNPAGHRLTNIVLHGLCAVSVFYLFALLLKTSGFRTEDEVPVLTGAAFAALLFAIHPLRVESVVWIAERKGLLAAWFFVLTLIAYIRYAGNPGKSRYAAALFCFMLALMSKPTVVMLPVILLLLDRYPLDRFQDKRLSIVLEKVPFFALSLIVGIVELKGEAAGETLTPLHIMSFADRGVHVVRSCIFYIEKTLLPFQLVPYYPIPTDTSFFSISFTGSLAGFLAITGMAIRLWNRGRFFWLAAWLYYLVASLPTLGIIHAGRHLTADRYSYFPTLSFYLIAGGGLAYLLKNSAKEKLRGAIRAGALSAAILLISGGLTLQQMKVWNGPITFWQYIANVYPNTAFLAYNNLGAIFLQKGLLKQAEDKLKTVIKLRSDLPNPHANLGAYYVASGHLEKAEKELRFAITLKPQHSTAHHDLGVLYLKKGLWEKSEAELQAAIKIQPNHYQAYHNLGLVYQGQGLIDKAIAAMETAYKINPDYEKVLIDLIKLFRENTSKSNGMESNVP